MFVGGEENQFEKAKGMLHAIARRVLYLGEAGCGQAAKMLATLQRASALIGVIESYATFKNSDVAYDAEEVMDTLISAGCVSPVNVTYVDAIRNKDFKGSYSVEVLMAELVAALSAADDKDHVLPQAEAGFRLLELLAMVGGAEYNPAALALLFEDEKAAERYGLDWSRVAGVYEEHDHEHSHDCDHGHDHSRDDDDYYDPDGFAGLGGISAN